MKLTPPVQLLLPGGGARLPDRGFRGSGPGPDRPEEVRLRAVLDAKLTFPAYVFNDEQFPVCAFEQPAKAEELLGPHTIKVTWYGGSQGRHVREGARRLRCHHRGHAEDGPALAALRHRVSGRGEVQS